MRFHSFNLCASLMLSYQHGYHAGNFADVIKHFTLTRILDYLTRKDKALFYLETHSGKGVYDFTDKQAKKTEEYKEGIAKFWDNRNQLPKTFAPYLQTIEKMNPEGNLRYYPGSPYLAMQLLRKQDRLYCCELHNREFEALNALRHPGMNFFCSHSDGIESLQSLVPPPEKRGLIFIDPAYELKDEYKDIPRAIKAAYSKFSTGTYCLWYPIVDKKHTERLVREMSQINTKDYLHFEFTLKDTSKLGMIGCGLWIINPPYVLEAELKEALKEFKRFL
jgi:23S rRNA (adenine2030-N6)-methyltransferase